MSSNLWHVETENKLFGILNGLKTVKAFFGPKLQFKRWVERTAGIKL